MYKDSSNLVIGRDNIEMISSNTFRLKNDHSKLLIPVTRYSDGMSRGLFYNRFNTTTTNYLGTFYYIEHESETFISVNVDRCRTFFNKTQAVKVLRQPNSNYLCCGDEDKKAVAHMNGEIPQDLMMTPCQVVKAAGYKYNGIELVTNKKRYAGFQLLYGAEDNLDQPLAQLCVDNGIDVLILTHVAGSCQVVAEVLDVRDRSISFSSLVSVR